jgi:hypothetical protein
MFGENDAVEKERVGANRTSPQMLRVPTSFVRLTTLTLTLNLRAVPGMGVQEEREGHVRHRDHRGRHLQHPSGPQLMNLGRTRAGYPVIAVAFVAVNFTLAACSGASATTPPAVSPGAAQPAGAPAAAQPPLPVNPSGISFDNDLGGNWKQTSWAQYLADLGVVPGDRGECLAVGVELVASFAHADAVAKAFPPGTSGKSGDDYVSALRDGGMDAGTAFDDVTEVSDGQIAQLCPGDGGIGNIENGINLTSP